MADINWAQLLRDRPDVLAEFQDESSRDGKSIANLQRIGAGSPELFAKWWYDNYGAKEGYSQTPAAATPTPTAPTPTTPTANPEVDNLSSTLNSLLGLFNQQQSKAQQADAAKEAARSSVSSTLGSSYSKLSSGLLGNTVNDILAGQYDKSKVQLDRGLARGMFNDVGYQAGLSSLERNKLGVKTKLNTTANDILSGYRKQYDDLRNEALSEANNTTGSFSIDPYKLRADEILADATANAGGALQSQIGNTQLFDLNTIRGDAGTAQGALNLKNLDVLDALAKRKQAMGVGRGLGSQGSF